MTNQLNFGSPIRSFSKEQMYRLSSADQALLIDGEKSVLFGTHEDHNIEMWFYFPDGTYASNIRLSVTDPDIGLTTTIAPVQIEDGVGVRDTAFEYLNLNLEHIAERADLAPGRYTFSVYTFRDEISSMDDENKLLIREISPDRTEVILSPIENTEAIAKDIYEFIVPSVPRILAKGILDETFGQSSAEFTRDSEVVTSGDIIRKIPQNSLTRLTNAQALSSANATIQEMINRTYGYALQAFSNEYQDTAVQQDELQAFVDSALQKTITEMKLQKEIDPRFVVVDLFDGEVPV